MSHIKIALAGMLLFGVAGCGQDGPARGDVSGKVTIAAEPIVTGLITFIPELGVEGPPAEFAIVNGNYSSSKQHAGPPIGRNKVTFYAQKKTGRKVKSVDGSEYDEYAELVPRKYNEESATFVDVVSGSNTFDFDLEGKLAK